MMLQVTVITFLLLIFHAPLALGQKCKGYSPKGPGRAGAQMNSGEGPRIKSKPEAEYTREARRRNIQGTVILRAVLHSTGKIKDVCVVQGLPYGLTKKAIEAAYKIEFEPARKEGRPVSYAMLIQYEFSKY